MCSTPKNSGRASNLRKLKVDEFDASYSSMLKRASARFEQRQQEKLKRKEAD